ncbi:MAG: sigma-70 family RNA polymerase sigma factor [Pirellulales bacterium]|nr:sigma-70 family RNA polymerase sigma factor [Pirellulales bacterium]
MPGRTRQELAYQELIEDHQSPLRAFILAICPDHSSVEDILQETNRVLWEKRTDFQLGTNFLAWARKIAQFQTMSFLKTSKRKSWLRFDSELVQALAEMIETQDKQRNQRAEALKHCLSQLSETDTALIQWRYKEQLSVRQISLLTSRSEGALKQVYLRIRNQLRLCLERKILAEQSRHDEA